MDDWWQKFMSISATNRACTGLNINNQTRAFIATSDVSMRRAFTNSFEFESKISKTVGHYERREETFFLFWHFRVIEQVMMIYSIDMAVIDRRTSEEWALLFSFLDHREETKDCSIDDGSVRFAISIITFSSTDHRPSMGESLDGRRNKNDDRETRPWCSPVLSIRISAPTWQSDVVRVESTLSARHLASSCIDP